MNKEQALANLYNAARLARLSADEHAVILESAKILQEAIKPAPEAVKEDESNKS